MVRRKDCIGEREPTRFDSIKAMYVWNSKEIGTIVGIHKCPTASREQTMQNMSYCVPYSHWQTVLVSIQTFNQDQTPLLKATPDCLTVVIGF